MCLVTFSLDFIKSFVQVGFLKFEESASSNFTLDLLKMIITSKTSIFYSHHGRNNNFNFLTAHKVQTIISSLWTTP